MSEKRETGGADMHYAIAHLALDIAPGRAEETILRQQG